MSRKKYASAEDSYKTALGARIRVARGEKTQEWMAESLGVSLSRVSEWEGGKKEPRAATLKRIAAATGCDPSWLLTGEQPAASLKVRQPSPPYSHGEISEMIEAVREIMEGGVEQIIRALRTNLEAFLLSTRALRGQTGEKVARKRLG